MWLHPLLRASALFSVLAIVVVMAFLAASAWPFLASQGPSPLWQLDWYPYEDHYGFLAPLVGTFWAVGLAIVLALPPALAAALLTAELLDERAARLVRLLMELLAGVPSVVYGLIGMWLLVPFLEHGLDLLTGRCLLAAAGLLALMMLPTLMLLIDEALRGVPREQHEAAAQLGLDWTARMRRVALPQAGTGIRAAVLLSSGRALGETIAVMLVVGSIDRLPDPWYDLLQPAQTLTSRIGRELGEAAFGSLHWSALMAGGLLLAGIAAGLAALAHLGRRRA